MVSHQLANNQNLKDCIRFNGVYPQNFMHLHELNATLILHRYVQTLHFFFQFSILNAVLMLWFG